MLIVFATIAPWQLWWQHLKSRLFAFTSSVVGSAYDPRHDPHQSGRQAAGHHVRDLRDRAIRSDVLRSDDLKRRQADQDARLMAEVDDDSDNER